MAGSIRESGIAEPAVAMSQPSAIRHARGRRWEVLRQAARTRLGPLGVVVMLIAVMVALLAPVISP
jgi:hypothetical protein